MPEKAKPKVLIADDERVIADTLAAILNQGGFEARAVYSCVKALEVAPAFKPDLLISDVIMSEMNGIEAAIRIRAILPDIRVFPSFRADRHRRVAGKAERRGLWLRGSDQAACIPKDLIAQASARCMRARSRVRIPARPPGALRARAPSLLHRHIRYRFRRELRLQCA